MSLASNDTLRWLIDNGIEERLLAERLTKLFEMSSFAPWSKVKQVMRRTWVSQKFGDGGYIFELMRDTGVQTAVLKSRDPGATTLWCVHGTTHQGAAGILTDLYVLGSSTLNGNGIWCQARPYCTTWETKVEVLEKVCRSGRHQCGVAILMTCFMHWVKMKEGGHEDETEIIEQGSAVHKPSSGRWAIPVSSANLWGFAVDFKALEGEEAFF